MYPQHYRNHSNSYHCQRHGQEKELCFIVQIPQERHQNIRSRHHLLCKTVNLYTKSPNLNQIKPQSRTSPPTKRGLTSPISNQKHGNSVIPLFLPQSNFQRKINYSRLTQRTRDAREDGSTWQRRLMTFQHFKISSNVYYYQKIVVPDFYLLSVT